MKLKPYPSHKNCDLLWADSIPAQWDIKQVKHLFSIGRGRVIAETELEDDGLYPVYSSQTQNDGCMGYIKTYDFDCEQLTWTTDGANAGTVFIRNNKHNCTNVCGTLQPIDTKEFNLRFYLHSLSYITQFYKRPDTNGAKIMNGEMAVIKLPHPSLDEQNKISEFIDRETTKLDTLIAKQEKLIELLQEKRQAIISYFVTKGLDPNVKMKDSGVEWLGMVPEHWEVWQSRRLFTQRKERLMAEDEQLTASQKYGVIPQKLFMELEDQRVMQVFTGSEILKHVEPNDFVISMRTFQGGIEHSAYRGCVSSAYVPLIPSKKVLPEFFRYLFKSLTYIQALQSTTNLVRDGQALRFDNFAQVPLPVVTLDEQHRIVDFLDSETNKIDKLIEKSKKSIELAKEHRTALISAAVTGKIDVRDIK